MAKFWFEHPTVFLTVDEGRKANSHIIQALQAMHIVYLKPTWHVWHAVV